MPICNGCRDCGIVTCALNKRRGYLSGNKEDLRIVQSQRKRIREREGCYREEMEVQLHQNNHSGVCSNLKTVSDHKETKTLADGDERWENDLTLFANWFDQVPAPSPTQSSLLQLPLPPPAVDFHSTPPPTTTPSVHPPGPFSQPQLS